MASDPDLHIKAHRALIDLVYELRREAKGVRAGPPVTDPFAVPDWGPPKDTGIATSKTIETKSFAGTRPAKVTRNQGESTAEAYVRSLGIEALMTTQVAELLGVSPQLVRKWRNDDSVSAPSLEVPFGKNVIYLYTPEDVAELRRKLVGSRTPRPRRT